MPLMLASPAFAAGGTIPAEYTCDGADISPPLRWSGVPPDAKSLVLVLDDPDAPGRLFTHWAAWDIPPGASGLPAGFASNRLAIGFREGRNDFGTPGYRGPCPPAGSAHHYQFKLLAISRPRLELSVAAPDGEVLRAAQPYVIQQAVLTGTYHR
jgi:Raf kinase inhibitor-like YbhB/YbcL family protein